MLATLHRRMTVVGQTKNLQIYQATAKDTELSIKFTTGILQKTKEEKE